MSLEQLSYLAQIVASFGVFLSMIFVGMQIRQNTAALQRNEHNISMEEWASLRKTIATNREVAELMTTGLSGEHALRLGFFRHRARPEVVARCEAPRSVM